MPAALWVPTRGGGVPARYKFRTHRRTRAVQPRPFQRPSPAKLPSAIRRARSHPPIFFLLHPIRLLRVRARFALSAATPLGRLVVNVDLLAPYVLFDDLLFLYDV